MRVLTLAALLIAATAFSAQAATQPVKGAVHGTATAAKGMAHGAGQAGRGIGRGTVRRREAPAILFAASSARQPLLTAE